MHVLNSRQVRHLGADGNSREFLKNLSPTEKVDVSRIGGTIIKIMCLCIFWLCTSFKLFSINCIVFIALSRADHIQRLSLLSTHTDLHSMFFTYKENIISANLKRRVDLGLTFPHTPVLNYNKLIISNCMLIIFKLFRDTLLHASYLQY